MIDVKQLLKKRIHLLKPLNDLPSADRNKLMQTANIVKYQQGQHLNSSEAVDSILYLLNGDVEINYDNEQNLHFDNASTYAGKPLFKEHEPASSKMNFLTDTLLWQFDRKLFNRLIEKELIVNEHILSRDISHVESSIYNRILQAAESGKLKLPSLPEIALRIKKAVEDSEANITEIAKVIELDPALSARLMKVANSALNRGVNPIHSMRDIIVRLGLKFTRNLVISFSVAQLFKSRHPVLKKKMSQFYHHSIEIASICFALGVHSRKLDADELLLAGLIHDIGVIPVITYIDETGFEFNNEQEIEQLIKSLRVAVGVMVIKSWDLPTDMLNVVTHAEHWRHDSGGDEVKLEDIVIIAQIYDLMNRKQLASLPEFKNIPAMKKLFHEKHDPAFAMEVLDLAREEITEMKSILGI